MSCGRASITPLFDCSGHGACVNATCICYAGYTGVGDWSLLGGLDCHISQLAHAVLFGVLGLIFIGQAAWGAPLVAALVRARRRARRRIEWPLWAIIVRLVAATPLFLALILIEVFTPQRIAVDPAPTLLFFLARSSIYAEALMHFPVLLDSVLSATREERTRILVRANYLASAGHFSLMTLVGVLVFVPLGEPIAELALYTCIAYHAIVGILCLFMSAEAHFMLRRILIVLPTNMVSGDANLAQVRRKLIDHLIAARNGTSVQALVCFLFGMLACRVSKC